MYVPLTVLYLPTPPPAAGATSRPDSILQSHREQIGGIHIGRYRKLVSLSGVDRLSFPIETDLDSPVFVVLA